MGGVYAVSAPPPLWDRWGTHPGAPGGCSARSPLGGSYTMPARQTFTLAPKACQTLQAQMFGKTRHGVIILSKRPFKPDGY